MTKPTFIPGLLLSEQFFNEAVRPILQREFPSLKYSAGLIGYGSDVLGFDTEISMDHEWGPRLLIFLSEADYDELHAIIYQVLSDNLPPQFAGFSTNFTFTSQDSPVQYQAYINAGPVNHKVWILTYKRFIKHSLGIGIQKEPTFADWLTFPEQRLLEVTAGIIFHDDLEIDASRKQFSWYPHEVWLYVLASQWKILADEEAFVGRCGDVGDELGSRLLASKQVNIIMKLAFLIEKRYAPYPKWLGTAFSCLSCAELLIPFLESAVIAGTWQERERALGHAYEAIGSLHNQLQITTSLDHKVRRFHERPYMVIDAERFASEIQRRISEPKLKSLPLIGSVNQFMSHLDTFKGSELQNYKCLYTNTDCK